MPEYPITHRSKLIRGPKRACYDVDLIHSVLDASYLCHIGAQMTDRPMVQPTAHWRVGDKFYIHGSTKNGLFQTLLSGAEACINVTLFDGLVMARSAFHHSANYRSVTIFSKARNIETNAEKTELLHLMMVKYTPDRADDIRAPNAKELKATTVLEFDIQECSAKVRSGPPVDDDEDYALPVWAGVVPLVQKFGSPINDPRWEEEHGD